VRVVQTRVTRKRAAGTRREVGPCVGGKLPNVVLVRGVVASVRVRGVGKYVDEVGWQGGRFPPAIEDHI
jgi:hypothetical protein